MNGAVHCECEGVQGCGNQKPIGPVDDCCVSLLGIRWVRPLADNTILHLTELETGGVRL